MPPAAGRRSACNRACWKPSATKDRSGDLPRDGRLGLLGTTIQGYGCAGSSYVDLWPRRPRIPRRVDSGYRSMMSVQSSLAMYPIAAFGSGRRSSAGCRHGGQGELIGCFGLTEPNHGSDPGSMATRAKKVAGGWSLTGSKMWILFADRRRDGRLGQDDAGEIRGFLLEKGMKGLSTPAIHGKMGCAPRSPARSSWTRCSCRRKTCCPG